ncbi:hypothetical protein [Collimonas pratensis]|uniref:hypothetical protein n=1 Tax=Collimonas pratensis TaxID=279113 RepID=UPI000780EEE1|nr:hypothetical protein [Collimonas pratensis]
MYFFIAVVLATVAYFIFKKKSSRNPEQMLDEHFSIWLRAYSNAQQVDKEQLAYAYMRSVINAGEKFQLLSRADSIELKALPLHEAREAVDGWIEVALPHIQRIVSSEYVSKSPAWLIGTLMLAGVIDLDPERGIRKLLTKIS